MQNVICGLIFLFISSVSFLGADLLPYSPGLGAVEYTDTVKMSMVEGSGDKKKLIQEQDFIKTEVNWISQDEIHIKLVELSINLTGKVGKKPVLKWKFNAATKKSSLKAADEIWDECSDAFSTLKVGFDGILRKKMVFIKNATGRYQETTGTLARFNDWMEDELMSFKDLQHLGNYQHFIDHILYFANKDIHVGKQQFPAAELMPLAKMVGLNLSSVTYNFKRGQDNGYFAYTHSEGVGKKKGAKLVMKSRGKIEWNTQNALLHTEKNVVTVTAKKKGQSAHTKIKTLRTSRAL